jgi:hypothetical protein
VANFRAQEFQIPRFDLLRAARESRRDEQDRENRLQLQLLAFNQGSMAKYVTPSEMEFINESPDLGELNIRLSTLGPSVDRREKLETSARKQLATVPDLIAAEQDPTDLINRVMSSSGMIPSQVERLGQDLAVAQAGGESGLAKITAEIRRADEVRFKDEQKARRTRRATEIDFREGQFIEGAVVRAGRLRLGAPDPGDSPEKIDQDLRRFFKVDDRNTEYYEVAQLVEDRSIAWAAKEQTLRERPTEANIKKAQISSLRDGLSAVFERVRDPSGNIIAINKRILSPEEGGVTMEEAMDIEAGNSFVDPVLTYLAGGKKMVLPTEGQKDIKSQRLMALDLLQRLPRVRANFQRAREKGVLVGPIIGAPDLQSKLAYFGKQDPAAAAYESSMKEFVSIILKMRQGSRPSDWDLRFYMSLLPMLTETGSQSADARFEEMQASLELSMWTLISTSDISQQVVSQKESAGGWTSMDAALDHTARAFVNGEISINEFMHGDASRKYMGVQDWINRRGSYFDDGFVGKGGNPLTTGTTPLGTQMQRDIDKLLHPRREVIPNAPHEPPTPYQTPVPIEPQQSLIEGP